MVTVSEQLILYVTILSLLVKNSVSINCYRCSGTNSKKNLFQCNEWLDSDNDLTASSCDDVYDAKFCVKHTGRYEDSAIDCYQCSSSETIDCTDVMLKMGAMKPKNCSHVFEAEYCIKSTSLDGGVATKRFCSAMDLGNYCNYVQQPGDILNYRTCVFTCSGDGCNPAYKPSINHFLALLPIFILLRTFLR